MCCDNEDIFKSLKYLRVLKIYCLVRTSLRVVGDCQAAKPSAGNTQTAAWGFIRMEYWLMRACEREVAPTPAGVPCARDG